MTFWQMTESSFRCVLKWVIPAGQEFGVFSGWECLLLERESV